MIERKEIENEKTILVGTVKPGDTNELIIEHLNELELLAETAGAEVVGKITQKITKINSATFIGKGKANQIINQAKELKANLIIFDDELSPAQIKNYYNFSKKVKILDRSGLILDIFRKQSTLLHSHNRERKQNTCEINVDNVEVVDNIKMNKIKL